jgi:hypothetical protein
VDPDATGLNPAWRNSLAYATLGAGWEDGATLEEIEVARQLLIQDMKILEGIAPDSGAYFNEVRFTRLRPHPRHPLTGFGLSCLFTYPLCARA